MSTRPIAYQPIARPQKLGDRPVFGSDHFCCRLSSHPWKSSPVFASRECFSISTNCFTTSSKVAASPNSFAYSARNGAPMYSPSSHIWYGYRFLCQKPPSDVRGWSRICWRSRSMALRYFSRPVLR